MSPKFSFALTLIVFLAVFPGGASAQESDSQPESAFPDKVWLSLGYMRLGDMSTDISLNNPGTGNIGTRIDYSRDLGGDSSADVGRLRGHYRFNDRHRLDFSVSGVNRSGDAVLGVEIRFGDEVFEANERVKSSIDTETFKLAYAYSFYHSPQVELSLAAGLHILRYDMKLTSTRDGDDARGDVTAPLPVWGMRSTYFITPRWQVNFGFETFYLELEDYSGSFLDTELETEYRLARNVGVGLGFTHLGLDLDADTSDFRGSVSDIYRGFELFVAVRF